MNRHEELFLKMQRTSAGWRAGDFRTLYTGYGFAAIEGSNHTIYRHPKYPLLRATVPRHPKEMANAYARDAVKLVEQLLQFQTEDEGSSEEEPSI